MLDLPSVALLECQPELGAFGALEGDGIAGEVVGAVSLFEFLGFGGVLEVLAEDGVGWEELSLHCLQAEHQRHLFLLKEYFAFLPLED